MAAVVWAQRARVCWVNCWPCAVETRTEPIPLPNILYAFKALKDNGLKPGHGPRGFGVIGCFVYVFLFYV